MKYLYTVGNIFNVMECQSYYEVYIPSMHIEIAAARAYRTEFRARVTF
jgi:hypothetical protein